MYFSIATRTTATVACVISTCAFAQNSLTSPIELDPIIVTATRSPEPVQATIGDNSVITREVLNQTPDTSFAEVLSRQHGITYINRGGPQTVSAINVRGTNSKQSLVLVDGMRVNSPTNGLPILNAIPLNAIERIEIMRGAASSIYGADAIGGVINVITRQAGDRPLQFEANAGVGTYATSKYSASLSGSQNGWTYSLYGGYGQSHGFDATNGDYPFAVTPDSDSYYESDIGGQLGYTWAEGQTLSIQTLQSRVNGGFDTLDRDFNDRGIQTLGSTIVTSRNQINERWLSTLSASFMSEKNETQNNPMGAGDGYFRSKQQQYQWLNRFELTDTQYLTIGAERLEQSVDAYSYGAPVTFDNDSLFTNSLMAIYTGQWGIHQVQASVRNDYNSQYGNFTTGSLGYAIDITRAWRANISANTAFRAPTFNELYYPGFSNPNLEPERSRNIEFGLTYRHSSGELGLTGYYNQIKDLIVSQAPSYIPDNVDTAVIKGLTLTATQVIGRNTVINASYDLLSPYNTTNDELLPFNAQRVLRVGGTHQMGEFEVNADWYLTSSRQDGAYTLGGYGLFNLGASYAVDKHLQLQVQWNNVFGKNYTLVRGFNTPGSNVFFNVKATY
ncbi:TonB-dependent receptor domain-containing protein [Orrella daihaiensis]|uniref:TonB-dependent receptor n=1 Tax=Orrella daihaiensis TaxID=2782176 RepID=A0ABY4AK85_9BURK|nr:TonB-dependent receptor [Orrella daihaiensis]UOD50683.1 TonB-dependent receptor [Orrella daihaiensis]